MIHHDDASCRIPCKPRPFVQLRLCNRRFDGTNPVDVVHLDVGTSATAARLIDPPAPMARTIGCLSSNPSFAVLHRPSSEADF